MPTDARQGMEGAKNAFRGSQEVRRADSPNQGLSGRQEPRQPPAKPNWRKHRDSNDSKYTDRNTQRYFDSVFSAVDSYCSDPDLIDEDDLDDQGLLKIVLNLKSSWEKSVAWKESLWDS